MSRDTARDWIAMGALIVIIAVILPFWVAPAVVVYLILAYPWESK